MVPGENNHIPQRWSACHHRPTPRTQLYPKGTQIYKLRDRSRLPSKIEIEIEIFACECMRATLKLVRCNGWFNLECNGRSVSRLNEIMVHTVVTVA